MRSGPRRSWGWVRCGPTALSSSAAQLQATPSSLLSDLLTITGVLDFGTTIFTWQSLVTCAVLIALTTVIAHFSAPRGAAIVTAEDLDVDLNDENEEVPPRSRPGEWLEYSRILPVFAGLMTLGWLVSQLVTKPVLSVVSSLNGYLLVFLILGLVLHGTPTPVPAGGGQSRSGDGRHPRPVPALRGHGRDPHESGRL